MKKNLKLSAAVIATIFGIISCAEHAQFSRLGRNGINTPDNSKTTGGVTTDFYTQDGGGSTQVDPQVDLLFIFDNSGSMGDNIAAAKTALGGLVQNLVNNGVDVCTGVMLAAPGAQGSVNNSGFLITAAGKSGPDADKVVCVKTDGQAATVSQTVSNLSYPIENTTFNESGLMSYMNLITLNKELAISQGFLRDNATLAVIFIADEDDICYESSTESSLRTTHCKNSLGNAVGPQQIYNSVSAFQGLNGVFSAGVVYTQDDAEVVATFNDETGIGNGYIQFLENSKGKTISMTLVNNQTAFNTAFSSLADPITQAAELETTFDLSKEACPATIAVTVDGNAVTNFTISSNNQRIRIAAADAGTVGSTINISYTAKPLQGC